MGVRLFKYSPCVKFWNNLEVEIEEDKQVCYGSSSQNNPAGTCDGDAGCPIFFIKVRYLENRCASLESRRLGQAFMAIPRPPACSQKLVTSVIG